MQLERINCGDSKSSFFKTAFKNKTVGWAWYYIPVAWEAGRGLRFKEAMRQEELRVEASVGTLVKLCLSKHLEEIDWAWRYSV